MTPADMTSARLNAALGEPGSGRVRYAAAMQLYAEGRLSAEVVEVYRICSPHDWEDPRDLLAARGLAADLPAAPENPEAAVQALICAIDEYLSGLTGPGIGEVRRLVARWRDGPVVPGGRRHPVTDIWLDPALDLLAPTHAGLARAIRRAAPYLDWVRYAEYPPEAIGATFLKSHAFATIMGAGAPVSARDFDLGLFLIAPHVLYRDHAHPAPELYLPLTGPHGWRFGPDQPLVLKPAHEPVWNDPERPHLTKVGRVPFLCIFGWTQDVALPAHVLPAGDWDELERLRIGD